VGTTLKLYILSDVHYAGAAEKARVDYCYRSVTSPRVRFLVRLYRHFFWQRDPFAHNHLLDKFIRAAKDADLVIANGDYACDSAFVGVADDPTLQSAAECLTKLRAQFGHRLHAVIGDHELGKKPLGAKVGGMRLESFRRSRDALALQPFWTLTLDKYVLIGITATLLALPVLQGELLENETDQWHILLARHIEEIRRAFADLAPSQRAILFCHDPTALPYLAQIPEVRAKLPQVERTIIGHLHSNLVLFKSRLLCGMPVINFLGHTPQRISRALRQARDWKPFNVLLCPSLAGIQLLKDGGYLTIDVDPTAKNPARFRKHRLPWKP
jgi:predicted MPP superfamily phosphohydrolase